MAKTPNLVIDIGQQRIKVLQVRPGKGGVNIVKAGVESLMLTSAAETEVFYQRIQETLPILLQRLGIKEKRAIVTLPGRAAFSRRLKIPVVRGRQLGRIIKYEAKQHIPYPLDQVNMDYRVSEAVGDAAELDVSLIAVRREVADAYAQVLKKCGIQSDIIEAAPLSIYNAYAASPVRDPNEVTAIISIGASSTDIVIEQGGSLQFMRSAPVAGNTLTALVAKRLEVPVEKAEELKIKTAEEHPDIESLLDKPGVNAETVSLALEKGFENIVSEIRRSFDFYVSQPDALPVTRVFLCGGSVKIKGVTEFLSDRLGIPVQLFDAVQIEGIQVPAEHQEFLHFEAALMGMAVRIGGKSATAMSFSPPSIKQRLELERRAPMLFLMVLLLLMILGGSTYSLQTMVDSHKQAVDQMNNIISPGVKAKPELQKGRNIQNMYNSRFDQIQLVADKRGFLTRVYLEVQRLIPPEIWLESVDMTSSKMIIKGRALNDQVIYAYIQKLSMSPFFDNNNVVLKEANVVSDSANASQPQISFNLQILQYNTPTEEEIKFTRKLETSASKNTILLIRFQGEKPDDPKAPKDTILIGLYLNEFEQMQDQLTFINKVTAALLESKDENLKKLELRFHDRNSNEVRRYKIDKEQMLAFHENKLSSDDFVNKFNLLTPQPSPTPTLTPTPAPEEEGAAGAYGGLGAYGGIEFSGAAGAPAAAEAPAAGGAETVEGLK